jgi:hypothetical protein
MLYKSIIKWVNDRIIDHLLNNRFDFAIMIHKSILNVFMSD